MLDINAIGQDTTFLGSVNMCPIEDLKNKQEIADGETCEGNQDDCQSLLNILAVRRKI